MEKARKERVRAVLVRPTERIEGDKGLGSRAGRKRAWHFAQGAKAKGERGAHQAALGIDFFHIFRVQQAGGGARDCGPSHCIKWPQRGQVKQGAFSSC